MREAWSQALPWAVVVLLALLALALLRRPIASLFRLAGRTGVGLAFLALFAPVGEFLGAGLGVNLFNALVLGLLGVPGFGLLLMLRWVLR
jgi:inhibitor of the pro-sigma K processing machinery